MPRVHAALVLLSGTGGPLPLDVRGFTPMTEKMDLEKLHDLINVYFGIMGNVVEEEGGFIDKFIGDKGVEPNSLLCTKTYKGKSGRTKGRVRMQHSTVYF